jgi:hypothetical protein
VPKPDLGSWCVHPAYPHTAHSPAMCVFQFPHLVLRPSQQQQCRFVLQTPDAAALLCAGCSDGVQGERNHRILFSYPGRRDKLRRHPQCPIRVLEYDWPSRRLGQRNDHLEVLPLFLPGTIHVSGRRRVGSSHLRVLRSRFCRLVGQVGACLQSSRKKPVRRRTRTGTK